MILKIGCILAGCLAQFAALAQGGVEWPRGAELVGGAVADDGQVLFVVSGETVDDGSVLVRRTGGTQDVFELPNTAVRGVSLLENGRLLLFSGKGPVIQRRVALSLDIVKTRVRKAVTLWSWNSRPECQRECRPTVVSSDGESWGWFSGDASSFPDPPSGGTFTIGSTRRASMRATRNETVEFSAPAYIVHLADGGSPYTVPVLQGGDQLDFRWQRRDRVLWVARPDDGLSADIGDRWRAYHLRDLGLSGMPSEAFWEHEKEEGWEPHPERGLVRVVRGEGAYRIEHLWREPSSSVEKRYVSDWHQGEPPRSRFGEDWAVSANGRHGAVLETLRLEGAAIEFNAASFDLRFEPRSQPPIPR